jgi:hypothetical protein
MTTMTYISTTWSAPYSAVPTDVSLMSYRPVLSKASTNHTRAPRNGKESKPPGSADTSQDDVARNFEQEVGDEEDEQGDRVAAADVEFEFLVHAGNAGVGDLRLGVSRCAMRGRGLEVV